MFLFRQTEPNEEELVKALEAQHIAEEQKKTEDIAYVLRCTEMAMYRICSMI